MTGANVAYFNAFEDSFQFLALGNQGDLPSLLYFESRSIDPVAFENIEPDSTSANSLRFTPTSSASVPGPLPLFGIAAAFAWSRRLRRRIKS